ncbi:unnamed protein product [Candidula unifasciata]|uniref:Uncharacterized protein n=1 Tax=Candidula unifasciata TaxID=100452 RepID=A0A8S3ZYE7_9EUPU|nr:unnamed protein product [Candidula unifasciata]
MHRTISVKYRIVRRVDIDKAPLATFDTVDLGDEDVQAERHQLDSHPPDSTERTVKAEDSQRTCQISEYKHPELFIYDGGLKSEIIGASSSKKSLTQAGGEEREGGDERAKDRVGCVVDENVQGSFLAHGTVTEVSWAEAKQSDRGQPEELQKTEPVFSDREWSGENDAQGCRVIPSLAGHGTIGRVHVPVKKQDSDSSSSSPGSCNGAAFTFQPSNSSASQLDRTGPDGQVEDADAKKDAVDNLVPEYFDPSQILSPSKRKAYERRIERLKVTTSPIARPRSTTPINVVTLDEYAVISSPDTTPATAFIVQDKLKITLPTDEFTCKPKTPKLPSARKHNIDDTCFEFTEEFLFSRTKAALVVADDGQLPVSPRRVLIPPNLTPSTSPKLSASPKLTPDSFYEDLAPDAPYLKEIQEIEATRRFFGTTVDESEEDNWADFRDIYQTDETEDNDTSTSTVCDTNEAEAGGSALLAEDWPTPAVAGDGLFAETFPLESASLFAESVPFTASSGHLDVLKEFLVYQEEGDFDARAQTVSTHSDQPDVGYENTSKYSEFFHESIVDSDADFPQLGYSGLLNSTSTSVTPLEGAHLAIDSDIESEEIITIEINHSAESHEKHIGIEIRSTGNSTSVSPICSDWLTGHRSPSADNFRAVSQEAPGFQRDRGVLSLAHDDNDSPALNGRNYPTKPDDNCTLENREDVQCSDTSLLETEIRLLDLQKTEHHVSSPIFDPIPAPDLNTTHTDFLPYHLPLHQHSLQQQQLPPLLAEEVPASVPRPPSTNPFDIDYEPLGSNPFAVGLQNPCTNPFLVHPSISSDLINFSFTSDNSSA